MKNRKIAEVLKAYRKMNNLSVRDVTELLEEKSLKVAEKTVYGWESSATQPDADTLLLLCDIYNIDNILGTFGYWYDTSKVDRLNIKFCYFGGIFYV